VSGGGGWIGGEGAREGGVRVDVGGGTRDVKRRGCRWRGRGGGGG
jgi:hypothetical protein